MGVLCIGGGDSASAVLGRGFGNGAVFGGVVAARCTGLGFGGAGGAARCGKRSGGGGSRPSCPAAGGGISVDRSGRELGAGG
jgi:hypothetical protein